MREPDPQVAALAILGEAMAGRGSVRAIVETERAGQAALVRSIDLPAKMRGDRPIFEAWGIEFGKPIGDGLFVEARLPPGWKKERTDHSLWSKLVDEKGRERAAIFYKAAIYDRDAHMSACQRYRIDGFHNPDCKTVAQAAVLDGEKVIWRSERFPITRQNEIGVLDRETGEYSVLPIRDQARAQAKAWLAANKPDWESALAY